MDGWMGGWMDGWRERGDSNAGYEPISHFETGFHFRLWANFTFWNRLLLFAIFSYPRRGEREVRYLAHENRVLETEHCCHMLPRSSKKIDLLHLANIAMRVPANYPPFCTWGVAHGKTSKCRVGAVRTFIVVPKTMGRRPCRQQAMPSAVKAHWRLSLQTDCLLTVYSLLNLSKSADAWLPLFIDTLR